MKEQGFYAWEETLRHHAYILMCQLLSMHDFEKLAYYPGAPDAINGLLEMEEKELSKNIMALAALSRANDDARNGLAIHHEQNPKGVGFLTEDGNKKVLKARDACNKIIHSETSGLDFLITKDHPLYSEIYKLNGVKFNHDYRVPILNLTGKRVGGKDWVAEVNMVAWIIAVANFGA
ncbi:hypothetical protein SKZ59_24470 [Janthinobacterium sp. GMG2]|uniref:hypothetical protein n=1 Tax=Janthinobacterium sp. GMG2 TaxID=3096606 RepID=UPI0029F47F5D|nr:hypothetical protein [Janthinobacterium sp. GMG2]MDX8124936.1 hypothetical protein [Janthinobacterium sp. GMG2]